MNFRRIFSRIRIMPTNTLNRIRLKFAGVSYVEPLEALGHLHVVNRGIIEIGQNCKLIASNRYNPIGFGSGINMIAEKNAVIKIGESCGMSNITLYAKTGISIGNRVLLGGGVKIYDSDFHSLDACYRGTPADRDHTISRPVVIEDDVFIGAGSLILKGVHIGEQAIIGAGSVVTKSIPAGEVWAGNPAKRIR